MDSLCAMLDAGRPADPRQYARWHWLHETAAKWQEAMRRCDDAWMRQLADVPDDISEEELEAMHIPDPPEEAEVNALWTQLNDVIQKDLWPKHLYFDAI